MNPALPEMLHCMGTPGNIAGNCTDMTVLERQRSRMKWQQDQIHEQQSYFSGSALSGVFQFQGLVGCESMLGLGVEGEAVARSVKPDPGLENGWPELGKFTDQMPNMGFGSVSNSGTGFQMNHSAISRTASCPPAVAAASADVKAREALLQEKLSFKKRKADKVPNTKVLSVMCLFYVLN